ncbi:helix-turn-helix domain-containing protein [Salegentibacter maritimus]|uniref:helix-turn-helix domain-containing protein n=1 Tax=Salegentibacter maritimus TaxID=2794347 RepID=UPI0018E4D1B2|nr:XRE family transcriptional regulator [Salegentibacter maritimus]MBI6118022.1 helix-turn-helix transcriptional regulator [Salegentibacter maritimus]
MNENKHITIWIGKKIRELRVSRNWKLGDLANYSEVSIPMLSKIENGRVFPTFPTLLQILKTLEVDLNEFFEDVDQGQKFPGYIMIKREDCTETSKEDSIGFKYETVLTHSINNVSLEVSILTLDKNASRECVTTEGYEYIYLIKGDISYKLGDKTFNLQEGDSLYFDGRQPHVPLNNLNTESVLLVVYLITI